MLDTTMLFLFTGIFFALPVPCAAVADS